METKVGLRNARGPLLPRPCGGPGRSERWDREAHTGVRRSAEDWCRGECSVRSYREGGMVWGRRGVGQGRTAAVVGTWQRSRGGRAGLAVP